MWKDLFSTKTSKVAIVGFVVGLWAYLSGDPDAPPVDQIVKAMLQFLAPLIGTGFLTLRHALLKGGAVKAPPS